MGPSMHDSGLGEALEAFGKPRGELPRRPILHGPAGTLFSFAVPTGPSSRRIEAVWVQKNAVRFFGPPLPTLGPGPSVAHRLKGPAAELFDRWSDASRAFHEAIEAIDERLSELEARGPALRNKEIWTLQRETAALRAQVGRAVVTASEASGPLSASFPGFTDALPSLLGELARAQSLASDVQQALSDLILLENARQSNRIAESANRLAETSNRIAEYANISNIRMLGITYIALVLGLVSAVVLIPNTAATILGMPSAGWVPGWWVDGILLVLAVVPLVLVFQRPWVRRILGSLREGELRAAEGIGELQEHVEGAPVVGPPRGS
jgi:hypothetical protein